LFGFLLRINYLERKKNTIEDQNLILGASTNQNEEEKKKYKKTVLSAEYIHATNKKIVRVFQDKKIFVDENLKLDHLSEILHISKNHLSQCISEGMETSFYDLVNKYRIEEFIRLLHENPESQITDLYYQCGFRSKATFYKYFKQEMQMNPNEYRRLILENITPNHP